MLHDGTVSNHIYVKLHVTVQVTHENIRKTFLSSIETNAVGIFSQLDVALI